MRHVVVISLIGVLVLSGCATLFTGTSDNIYFKSVPSGAEIFIDGLKVGKTPADVTVKRSLTDKQVVMKMIGYEDRIFVLQKEFNTVAILNLAGMLGWAIDAMTGSIFKYNPKNYEIDLEPIESSYELEELERDLTGRYIVPESGESVSITDNETGVKIVFSF